MMTFTTKGGTVFIVNGNRVTITLHGESDHVVPIADIREFMTKLDQSQLQPGIPEAHR